MPNSSSAIDVLEREFLLVRAKLLEIGAALDRLDRAEGSAQADRRLGQINQAIALLHDDEPDRAERIQMIFSLPYDSAWRKEFQI